MLRKLLLPIAATALLAGCVTTAPYGYRGGAQGDYYYGAPSVEYRYRGYADPYYGPYRPGFSIWGGYGYPYYSPYYGDPYHRYPYGYYPRPTHRPHPDSDAEPQPQGGPWRNMDEIVRRRRGIDGGAPAPAMPEIERPEPRPSMRPAPPRSGGEGSRMGDIIRRAQQTREN